MGCRYKKSGQIFGVREILKNQKNKENQSAKIKAHLFTPPSEKKN
jgi:hypothetical protein